MDKCAMCSKLAVRRLEGHYYCYSHWDSESKGRLKARARITEILGRVFVTSKELEEFAGHLSTYKSRGKASMLLKVMNRDLA